MTRIKTQDDFIAKAKVVHGDKYDYSLVIYTKSSEKVHIVCPEHGVFDKTPNMHLRGQGCPICGRNRTRLTKDDFVKRAIAVHGNRYDYSKVEYRQSKEKVEIVCAIHGSFWQTVHEHIILKHNCPKCGYAEAGLKRSGDKNVAHRDDVKQKKIATCKERFGTKTWAESDEGRKRLREIIVDDGKLDLMKATCQERYGTDFWTQSDEGKSRLHDIMSSDDMREKVKSGYENAYGMHYMQTDEGRQKAKAYIDDERREKMRQVMIERYGVPYAFLSEDVKLKIRETCMRKYGVPYVVYDPEQRQKMIQKAWETKRKNGTFNTSKPENTLYLLLCDVFGKDDVMQQYDADIRYPFSCDFYIKSLDLFIELNAHWSHGDHWFDETDSNDLLLLEKWQQKAKRKGSTYYRNAIEIWTKRDLMKRKYAEDNHLNYVVFWKNDLSDSRSYLSNNTQSSTTK